MSNNGNIADISSLNPQAEVLREKVAAAIRDEGICGASIDGGATTVFCDDARLVCPNKGCVCKEEAVAAIAATLQALIELELPRDTKLAAVQEPGLQGIFRAILTALLPLLTKGEK